MHVFLAAMTTSFARGTAPSAGQLTSARLAHVSFLWDARETATNARCLLAPLHQVNTYLYRMVRELQNNAKHRCHGFDPRARHL